MKCNQLGRSMVEIIGVLAIIGVLSVGAIAGYSTAMEKWKMNKAIAGYNYLVFNLSEHIDLFRQSQNQKLMGSIVYRLNAVPESWTYKNGTLYDPTGTSVIVMGRNKVLALDIRLGKDVERSRKKCVEIYKGFIQPLHESVKDVWIHNTKGGYTTFYGDKYCDGVYRKKCLKDMKLQDMSQVCKACPYNEQNCPIAVEF